MTDETKTPAHKHNNVTGALALVAAVAALAMASYPPVKAWLPWHTAAVDMTPLERSVAMVNARLDAVNEKLAQVEAVPAPAEMPADVTARLATLEEKVQNSDAIVTAQNEKLQQTTNLPIALAWVRVEERFERGQDFTDALALAQKLLPAPLDDESTKHLAAASGGVATTAVLLEALDAQERAVRRANRLAGVDNPIDRIWAELQSLILIKRVNEEAKDDVGRALAGLRTAVQTDDAAALTTAWGKLPEPGQKVLQAWKADADKRLAVRTVLNTQISATLTQ